MANPISYEVVASAGGFAAMIFTGIGSWWLKGIMGDVKELQKAQNGIEKIIERLDQRFLNHEKCEEERWDRLEEKLTDTKHDMKALRRSVELLIHRELLSQGHGLPTGFEPKVELE